MKGTRIGTRYARALLELAREQGQADKVGQDLAAFAEAWDASEALRGVFLDPANAADDRRKLVDALAARMDCAELLRNTVRLLSDRRRMAHLPEVAEAYALLAEETEGKVRAEVTSAVALSDDYYDRIQQALAAATGQEVVLVRKTDPSLIGGVVTRVGDTIIDGSLRTRMNELGDELLDRN